MANASTNVTFDEWVKRFDKSSTKTIIELAAASNLMLKTSNVAPGNESDGNTTTVRTSYPTGSWTSAYEGVASEASHTREVFDAAGYLEGYSIIAKRYVHRSPDRKAARMQEEKAFIIGSMCCAPTESPPPIVAAGGAGNTFPSAIAGWAVFRSPPPPAGPSPPA